MVKVTGDLIVTGVIRGTVENQINNSTDVTFAQDVTINGKLQTGGSEDTVQVIINAHQHQIDNILEINNADGDQCVAIDRTGAVTLTTLEADKVESDQLEVTGDKDEVLLRLKGNYSQSEDMVSVYEHTDDYVFRIKANGDVRAYRDVYVDGTLEVDEKIVVEDVSAVNVRAYDVSASYVYGSDVSANNFRGNAVYANVVYCEEYTVNVDGGDVDLYGASGGTGLTSGGDVSIYGGHGGDVSGNGGDLELAGGYAPAIGDGGTVTITGGAGAGSGLDNQGGSVLITAGTGSEPGSGGKVQLSNNTNSGGGNHASLTLATFGEYSSIIDASSDINFGNTPLVYQTGGCIAMLAGSGSDNIGGIGGEVTIRSGNGGTFARGGDMIIESGDATSGRGGNIDITAGFGLTDQGGDITLTGGDSSGSNTLGGAVNIQGGQGSEVGSGGQVYLENGSRTGGGHPAVVALSNYMPHELLLDPGSTVTFENTPTMYHVGGSVAVLAGDGSDTSGGVGGAIDIYAGDGGASDRGGNVTITAGTGHSALGHGGIVAINGGNSTDASGGDITLIAGTGDGGEGGAITIHGFDGINGGNIVIQAGLANMDGQDGGSVTIRAGMAMDSTKQHGSVIIGETNTGRVVIGSSSTHCYLPASRRRQTADVTVIESTTPENLTGLTFNYEAARDYRLHATLFVAASNTYGGIKVGYNLSTANLDAMIMQVKAYNNASCTYAGQAFATTQTQYLGDDVNATEVELVLSLKTTGAGTITLQGAQQTSTSGDTVLFRGGSYAIMEDITTA